MKNKNKKINKIQEKRIESLTGNQEIDNLIKVFALVAVIFLIFLGITYLVVNKEESKGMPDVETEIQYTNIMAGRILSMPEESYYVFIINEDDPYNGLYEQYLSRYSGKADSLPYYRVDLSNSFNAKYVSEESNLLVTKVEDLKFNKSAILRIDDNEISFGADDKDELVSYLEKLLEE